QTCVTPAGPTARAALLDVNLLPAGIRDKLHLLARRYRYRRWLHALNRAVLLLGLLLLAAYAVDAWLGLGRPALRLVLAGGGLLALLLAGLALFGRRPGLAAFAGLVERDHPELAERLSTLVALAETPAPHGHPEFVALLARQA